MKNIITSILLLITFISGFAQTEGDKCMFIYFKDGDAKVFLLSEIKGITHSNIDLDGQLHSEIISQEIETTDGVYSYLLEDIDKIEFDTPETEYQKNVVILPKEWVEHIKYIDDLTLILDETVDISNMLKKGDIIFSPDCLYSFNTAFAGRVTEIDSNSDITIKCEPVDVTDIFRKYITKVSVDKTKDLYSNIVSLKEADLYPSTRADETVKLEYGINSDGEYYATYEGLGIYLRPEFHSTNETIVLDQSEYLSTKNFIDVYGRIEYNLDKKADWHPERATFLRSTIPILPQFGLYINLNLGAYFELEGKIQANMNIPFEAHGIFGITRKDGEITNRENNWISSIGEYNSNIQLSGEIEAGIWLESTLALINRNLLSIGLDGKVGPSLKGDIYLFDTDWDFYTYKALKDSKIELSLDGEINAVLHYFNNHEVFEGFNPNFSRKINEWYLVPEFSNLHVLPSHEPNTINLHADINRDLLFPTTLGWRLYDQDMKLYKEEKISETYRTSNQWSFNGLERTFTDLPNGKKFTAVPNVTIFDINADADVSVPCKIGAIPFTNEATVRDNNVTLTGSILGEDLSDITQQGFYYSTSSTPWDGNFRSATIQSDNSIKVEVANLESKTTYYYCAYLEEDGEKIFGEVKSFITEENAEYYEWLKTLYESTNGDNWFHNDNWLSNKPYSEWYGYLDWDWDGGKLLYFDLSNNNLSGNGIIKNTYNLGGLGIADNNNLKSLYFENVEDLLIQPGFLNGLKLESLNFYNCFNNNYLYDHWFGNSFRPLIEIKNIKFENCNKLGYLRFDNILSENIEFTNCILNQGIRLVDNCDIKTLTLNKCIIPAGSGDTWVINAAGDLIVYNCNIEKPDWGLAGIHLTIIDSNLGNLHVGIEDLGSYLDAYYFTIINSYIMGNLINFSGNEEEWLKFIDNSKDNDE